MTIIADILSASRTVSTGRTPSPVLALMMSELGALYQEELIVQGRSHRLPAAEGPLGEAVDVLICAIDLAVISKPNFEEAALASGLSGNPGDQDLIGTAIATCPETGNSPEELLHAIAVFAGKLAESVLSQGRETSGSAQDQTASWAVSLVSLVVAYLLSRKPDLSTADIKPVVRRKLPTWTAALRKLASTEVGAGAGQKEA